MTTTVDVVRGTENQNVAIITLKNPPVNALALSLLRSFRENVQSAQDDDAIDAIVLRGENGIFSGGFDIAHLGKTTRGEKTENVSDFNEILTRLVENGKKPCVAAISNLALGGGLEVSMACAARVATRGAKLGLPELKLGVIPGFGGTQRLPRLVGLEKSLEMMLQSKEITSEEGARLGLVDEVVEDDGKSGNDRAVVEAAVRVAKRIANGEKQRQFSLTRMDKLPRDAKQTMGIMAVAEGKAKKIKAVLPHASYCVEAVKVGLEKGSAEGLRKESEMFQKAVKSPAAKGLVHFFFASRATGSVPGITDQKLRPSEVKSVGVVGGGLMGSGIATACLLSGMEVVLKEIKPEFLQAGIQRIEANIGSMVKKGKMKPEKAKAIVGRVRGTLDDRDFANVDMVIEAVIENLDLKRKIFSTLESIVKPSCILSTNTSTISIAKCASEMRNPERLIGAHFFSPAHVMQLFEIIRVDQTPPQILVDTLAFSKKIKKTPVVVGNCTGFCVNRVFFPYTMSATVLVDLGCDPYAIDRVISMFGMPMGPFRLADLVGMEVGVHVGKNFIEDFPERVYESPLIPSLLDAKRLGEKTKSGFYSYDDRRKASPDMDAIAPFIENARKNRKVPLPGHPEQLGFSAQDIVEMIFFPVVNEACRVLDEGVAVKAADVDVASVLGMGFPPFRGGILHWADQMGAKKIYARLTEFGKKYGGLYEPCAYLTNCAHQGKTIAEGPNRARL